MTDIDSSISPYEQILDEPDSWYDRFVKYYLALGPSRSLRKAWFAHMRAEMPESYDKRKHRVSADVSWSDASNAWDWRKRAEAYDAEIYAGALSTVEGARLMLLTHAEEAATTLVLALQSSRLKVAAAKEILDRAGLPAVKEVRLNTTPYSNEELQQAAKELEEWEAQYKSDESG